MKLSNSQSIVVMITVKAECGGTRGVISEFAWGGQLPQSSKKFFVAERIFFEAKKKYFIEEIF